MEVWNSRFGPLVQLASDNSKLIRSVDPSSYLPVSERTLRDQAIGRKNWLFLGSEQAGPRAAGLFKILALQAPRRAPHREPPHEPQTVRTAVVSILIAVAARLLSLIPTFLAPLLSIVATFLATLATFLSDRLPISKIPVAKRRKKRKA